MITYLLILACIVGTAVAVGALLAVLALIADLFG